MQISSEEVNDRRDLSGEEPARPVLDARTRLMVEIVGWCGAIAILAAYLCNTLGFLEPGRFYQFLNCSGAAAIVVVCWYKRTWQPMVLNIVWFLVGAIGFFRSLF